MLKTVTIRLHQDQMGHGSLFLIAARFISEPLFFFQKSKDETADPDLSDWLLCISDYMGAFTVEV